MNRENFLEAAFEKTLGGIVESKNGQITAIRAIRFNESPAVYLITSAQNNTKLHKSFWENLQAYAKHRKAKIIVSQFTYNKSVNVGLAKPGTAKSSDYDGLWYDPAIVPYLCNDRVELTKGLHFCGEMNISPTAQNPLSGFENYTGRHSSIFPHTRMEMRSVASPLAKHCKFIYTTGCCTLRNYIQRKAGLKADHFHAYGCLIVEVDSNGYWWVRQIQASNDGSFQDLDTIVEKGLIKTGQRVEGINWGDLHVAQMDPVVKDLAFNRGGILDTLKPRYQFMHDTLDFLSRNHHSMKDPHEMFRKYVSKKDDVMVELQEAATFLVQSRRDFCKSIVVESNHDLALMRWLREADYREDYKNAKFFLKCQAMVYGALAKGRMSFHLFKELMKTFGVTPAVQFLHTDESFVICRATGGIECGMHGHLGTNGSRGSALNLSKLGRPVNSGHTHTAGIYGDLYVAGTSSKFDLGYNRGPSAWSHSHIVTYPNGKRSIITIWKGKWRG